MKNTIALISLILSLAAMAFANDTLAAVVPDDACLVDQKALGELKKQRAVYEDKIKELSARETELAKREQAVQEELTKLQALKKEIADIKIGQNKQTEEKVAKFVEAVEGMSPKAASQLLSKIEEKLAIAAMAKMTTTRLAKIMNLMDPVKASQLSQAMTKESTTQ